MPADAIEAELREMEQVADLCRCVNCGRLPRAIAIARQARAESEGRRKTLVQKAEELRQEWQRAEKAEARVWELEAQLYQDALRRHWDNAGVGDDADA